MRCQICQEWFEDHEVEDGVCGECYDSEQKRTSQKTTEDLLDKGWTQEQIDESRKKSEAYKKKQLGF